MATPTVSVAANNQAVTTALAVTISTTGGHLLVIMTKCGGDAARTVTITDSAGTNTWVKVADYVTNGTDRAVMFYAANAAAVTSVTSSWTGTAATCAAVVVDIAGAATTSPLDGTAVTNTAPNGASSTSGALTTVNANDILVYGLGLGVDQAAGHILHGAGYTVPTNGQAARACIETQGVSAPQVGVTASFTWDTSNAIAMGVFAAFSDTSSTPQTVATVATLGQFSKDIVPNLCNFDTSMSLFYGAYDDDFVTQFSGTAFATATQVYSVPLGVFSKDAINGGFDPGL